MAPTGLPRPEAGTALAEPVGGSSGAPASPVGSDALERIFGLLRETARSAPEPFRLEERRGVLELAPDGSERCRLKVFRPREGKERLCAFFYKESNLSWSHDRYSYGAVEFLPAQVTEADMRIWLEWLAGGFDPERRPPRLKKAFLYSIPD